jgi:hypothetical protein
MAQLHEVTHCQTSPTIDRESGVIRGVKVLGAESKNGRRYSDKAMREAAGFYEGRDVNVNHPSKEAGNSERAVGDAFGWLESVSVKPDGVYADLHYLKEHPQAGIIVEAAERNPKRFGLSHNAEGTVKKVDGRNVVESINSVKSVDIVQTPATVNGLFESVRMTPREILEAWAPGMGSALPPVEGADDPMEPPDEGDDAEAKAKAAVVQLLTVALDAPGDIKSIVMQVMDVAQKIMGGLPDPQMPGDEETPEDEADPMEEDDSYIGQENTSPAAEDAAADPAGMARKASPFPMKKKVPAMAEQVKAKPADPAVAMLLESVTKLTERLDQQEARANAISLLESANRDVTDVRVKALLTAGDIEAQKSLVESWSEKPREYRGRSPVSQLRESAVDKYPDSVDKFVAAIR